MLKFDQAACAFACVRFMGSSPQIYVTSLICLHFPLTSSLAQWLRRPPREAGPGFDSRFLRGNLSRSSLALQWLPCQAPGVIGLAL